MTRIVHVKTGDIIVIDNATALRVVSFSDENDDGCNYALSNTRDTSLGWSGDEHPSGIVFHDEKWGM